MKRKFVRSEMCISFPANQMQRLIAAKNAITLRTPRGYNGDVVHDNGSAPDGNNALMSRSKLDDSVNTITNEQ